MSDDDEALRGTGEVIGTISVGEFGDIVFEDDGDDDSHTNVYAQTPDDSIYNLEMVARFMREKHGDGALGEMLASVDGPTGSVGTGYTSWPAPAYVCDDCHRTWPRGTNATPDADADTCPDCAE
jgi:hypothetical protein